jgi:(p)ppGpp synthase/HD superfamily hydrolase
MPRTPTSGTVGTVPAEELVESARKLAEQSHRGQFRKQTGNEFIEHPVAVAEIVASSTDDQETIAAAYLHDVLEKTDVNASQLRQRFGNLVADVVIACTEDPSLPCYADRKRDLRRKAIAAGRPASVIYAADRVANLRDWTTLDQDQRTVVGAKLGTNFEERLMLWREDLRDLSQTDPDLPFLAEIEIELRHLVNEDERAA